MRTRFRTGVREHVLPGTTLLVNLTNDGWFGEGPAQWQHAANAVFRCIENRVPMVRNCNNGLSSWVDRFGRVRRFLERKTGTFTEPIRWCSRFRLAKRLAARSTTGTGMCSAGAALCWGWPALLPAWPSADYTPAGKSVKTSAAIVSP